MPVVITLVFYSYTAIIGHPVLAVDITSFGLAVAVGQLVSYRLISGRELPGGWHVAGVALITVLAACFILFTYLPPHWGIFYDAGAGSYGIP